MGKYVRGTQRTEPTEKESEPGKKAHQENSRKKGLYSVEGGMTKGKAPGDKDQQYPSKKAAQEMGAEDTKSQDITNYWIVKADYSLELSRNLTWEDRREADYVRRIMGIFFFFFCRGDCKQL